MEENSDTKFFQNLFAHISEEGQEHFTSNYQFSFDSTYVQAVSGLVDSKQPVPAGQQLNFLLLISPDLASNKTEFVISYDDSREAKRLSKVYEIGLQGCSVIYEEKSTVLTRGFYHSIFLAKQPAYCPQIGLNNKNPQIDGHTNFITNRGLEIARNFRSAISLSGLYIKDVTQIGFEAKLSGSKSGPGGSDSSVSGSSSPVVLVRPPSSGCVSVSQTCKSTSSGYWWTGAFDQHRSSRTTIIEEHTGKYYNQLQGLVTEIEQSKGPIRFPTEKLNLVHPALKHESFLLIKKFFMSRFQLDLVEETHVIEILMTIVGHCFLTSSDLLFSRNASVAARLWVSEHRIGNFSNAIEWMEYILSKIACDGCRQDFDRVQLVILEATHIYLTETQTPLLYQEEPQISEHFLMEWWFLLDTYISGIPVFGIIYSEQNTLIRMVVKIVLVHIVVLNIFTFVIVSVFGKYVWIKTLTSRFLCICVWNIHGSIVVNLIRFSIVVCFLAFLIDYGLQCLQQLQPLQFEIRLLLTLCLSVSVQTTLTVWIWFKSGITVFTWWIKRVTVIVLVCITIIVALKIVRK